MSAPVRLSRETARAIDRLARRAHAFHRFAHHPLCARYATELVTLGRRQRVCRGCCAVVLGMACGGAAALVCVPDPLLLYGSLFTGTLLGLVSLTARLPKTLGRFLPAASLTAGLTSVLTNPWSFAWVVALATIALGIALYRRRQPNRAPCATCPERVAQRACSGFSSIVRRERAFRRVAERLIDGWGPTRARYGAG
jgi:hypothetical protein